ncbi:MAG: hypothetical protein J1D87_10870 [Lachnospiraceae bacterium]|nr:hypothetical protein [Lachnospiraceae bacterium]
MDNQNNKIVWDKSHNDIFENFALDLKKFTDTGIYPSCAGQDLKHGLELQFNRLKSKNLVMKYDIVPRGSFANGVKAGRQWRDNRYLSRMEFRTCSLSRTIYHNNKKVYENKQDSTFYQIITNVHNSDKVANEPYACPNCGAVSKIEVLQSGCPYCRTYFEMNELFPKVTNFYFIKDSGDIDQSLRRVMFACSIPSIVALTSVYCMRAENTAQIIYSIIGGIIAGIILGVVEGYILYAFFMLFLMFIEAGKSLPMLINSAGSGHRFVYLMKRYSPEFSFEYFSDKVVSLIKMIIYSDDAEQLPYYEGESIGNRFLDVIESSYRGAVALKRFKIQGDYCYVTVDVYLENIYSNDRGIYTKKDKVRVDLRKNICKPIDINFSIERIQCKNCGASFNAARMRNCPNCKTKYEMEDDDWIITKLY